MTDTSTEAVDKWLSQQGLILTDPPKEAEASKLVRALLKERDELKAMVGVIGQLEWLGDLYPMAQTDLGHHYLIRPDVGGGWCWILKNKTSSDVSFQSIEDAKAAAQADHEARIRSAFVTPPQDAIAKTVDVETERDAARYRWLRYRDVNTINDGGVFAGVTPDNYVLNGEDLDQYIDAAIRAGEE